MAFISLDPSRPGGRSQPRDVRRALIKVDYGDTSEFGPSGQQGKICTGGTSMQAVLGPDAASTCIEHFPHLGGTPTSQKSLAPLMSSLHDHSDQTWVAGHLLNGDWGGKGEEDRNLTPLTSGANSAHKFYENHVKNMLILCHNLDKNNRGADYWYGVHYAVKVSSDSFAETKDPADFHSYCASHITLDYRFIKLPKNDYLGSDFEEVPPDDSNIQALRDKITEGTKNKKMGDNVQNFSINGGGRISVEIHNVAQ
jgi:hypothetical protein